MLSAEVIDLTDDAPYAHERQVVNLVSDDDDDAQGSPHKKRRRNLKKKKRSKHDDDQPKVNGAPLPPKSEERPSRRDRRKHEERKHDPNGDSSRRRHSRSRSPARRKRREHSHSPKQPVKSPADRERSPQHRRSRSRDRHRSPTPFVVDTTAAILPNLDLEPPPPADAQDGGLVLPSHVYLLKDGEDPQVLERDMSPMSDSSFIDLVDLDPDARKTQRYFEEAEKPRIICSTCGQPGHIAKRCEMVVCLMCGAKDDHITPLCPVNKVCFKCNQKGHISKDCPNARAYHQSQRCDRCGLFTHFQNNCPLLWRTYFYLSEEERDELLSLRVQKRSLALGGGGGEGYIAMDMFCYNCAGRGHLGDDCPQGGRAERDRDPSAFSAYNQQFGPFSSIAQQHRTAERLRHRSASPNARVSALPEGKRRPGRDGREAAKRRAEEAHRKAEDDEDDWFGNIGGQKRAPNGQKKQDRNEGARRRDEGERRRGEGERKQGGGGRRREHERDRDHDRDWDRRRGDRDRDGGARRDGRAGSGWNDDEGRKPVIRFGPRFQGGYS